jgi:hypothetical protein
MTLAASWKIMNISPKKEICLRRGRFPIFLRMIPQRLNLWLKQQRQFLLTGNSWQNNLFGHKQNS